MTGRSITVVARSRPVPHYRHARADQRQLDWRWLDAQLWRVGTAVEAVGAAVVVLALAVGVVLLPVALLIGGTR